MQLRQGIGGHFGKRPLVAIRYEIRMSTSVILNASTPSYSKQVSKILPQTMYTGSYGRTRTIMAFFCSPCCHINAPIKDIKSYLDSILSSTKFTFSKLAQCLQNEPLHSMSSFHSPPFCVNVPIMYTSLFQTNSCNCSGQHQKL